MSANIPTHYAESFSTNVQLLQQQKGSKLQGCVTLGNYVGSQASPVDQIGAVEAQEVTSRFAPMGRVDAQTDRRWVFPRDFDLPQLIDSFDKLRLLTDPESKYVENAYLAMGRKKDALIIQAIIATAKTGVNGATSTSFTSGNEVDVAVGGTNSRLNVAKLRAVRELILANHIDMDEDPVYVGITAKDDSALLSEIEIISRDFNGADKPVLRDGKIEKFLNMNFVYCELIETIAGKGTAGVGGTDANECNIPVWAKSGMHLAMWNDIQTSISKRNDLQGEPYQAYVKMSIGATRIDEKKVFNIESYRA